MIRTLASEDVIIRLVESKCCPALLYGIDACPINKSQVNSLNFCLTGIFMKIFCTRSKDVAVECMELFNFSLLELRILQRKRCFLSTFIGSLNQLCNLFSVIAETELNDMDCRSDTVCM